MTNEKKTDCADSCDYDDTAAVRQCGRRRHPVDLSELRAVGKYRELLLQLRDSAAVFGLDMSELRTGRKHREFLFQLWEQKTGSCVSEHLGLLLRSERHHRKLLLQLRSKASCSKTGNMELLLRQNRYHR